MKDTKIDLNKKNKTISCFWIQYKQHVNFFKLIYLPNEILIKYFIAIQPKIRKIHVGFGEWCILIGY